MEINSSSENKTTPNFIDLRYLNDLADGNFDFVSEMITMFLNSVPNSVKDLESSIETSDWERVKAISHRIKPSFGFIGAKDVQESLNQMERNAIESPDVVLQKKLFAHVKSALQECIKELQTELDKNNS